MASTKSIFSQDILLLGAIGVGAYFLLKKPIDQALGGASEAIYGAGSGVGDALAGAGSGIGNAISGAGSGIGTTFSEIGQTFGAGGDYLQTAAAQAQADLIQEAEIRRNSQARQDYATLLEQARLENERIKAAGSYEREAQIQIASYETAGALANAGKSLKNASNVVSNATGIASDFSQGSRNLLGDLGDRLQRGTDIALRALNTEGAKAWNLYTAPSTALSSISQQALKSINNLFVPGLPPSPVAPNPQALAKASANATSLAGNDPKVVGAAIAKANAAQVEKELAKAQASKGAVVSVPTSSGAVSKPAVSSSTSKPSSFNPLAPTANAPQGYKWVVVNGLKRTVKV